MLVLGEGDNLVGDVSVWATHLEKNAQKIWIMSPQTGVNINNIQ